MEQARFSRKTWNKLGTLAPLIFLLAACTAAPGPAAPPPQPIVLRDVHISTCYDGDTCNLAIRLAGIDAPEIKGKCPQEKTRARAARDRLRQIIRQAREVDVEVVGIGKYRRLIVILTADGVDVGQQLVAEGHARPYDYRKGRQPWC